MDFDEVLQIVLRDKRSEKIPILYVIEVVIILDDLGVFKEAEYEQLSEYLQAIPT